MFLESVNITSSAPREFRAPGVEAQIEAFLELQLELHGQLYSEDLIRKAVKNAA